MATGKFTAVSANPTTRHMLMVLVLASLIFGQWIGDALAARLNHLVAMLPR